ncbi:hypothetical protein SDC9_73759 [bioreactor metagenome]|uniref:DUF3168 domain-containing protein n=1 Tax=bioreactor metagenome TaxID=1076179 RepID=A0A644YFY8_9ZZZZ
MTNIYALVCGTLEPVGFPVGKQGSFSAEDEKNLPETYITYQVIDTPSKSYADNRPTGRSTRIQLTMYSSNPELTQGADSTFKAVMIPAGFMRVGGRDLPYDPSTGRGGYTCDYRYYDMED